MFCTAICGARRFIPVAERAADFIDALAEHAECAGQRLPLLICGADDAVRSLAEEWIADPQPLLVARRALAAIQPCERRQLLGTECDLLVVDLWSRPDVNTLVAAAGCLRRGGLLLMLAPEPRDWSTHFAGPDGRASLFWQHVLRCLEQSEAVAWWSLRDGGRWPLLNGGAEVPDLSLPTADQLQAMARMRRVLHGHRRRPLVLRADRGRGKSAAMGLCAAEFLQENSGDVLLTAPRREAAATVLQHAAQALGDSQASEPAYGDSRLRFYAPDRLLQERPAARIVLVDEAAAIPPAILEQILRHYPRVIFATTVHGYEGSGRGFDIRFTDVLDALTPQWQRCELQEPIRWNEDDALEPLINRCFLLDSDAPSPRAGECDGDDVQVLNALTLFRDEALLRDIFGLLVAAHYQTSPADVQQMLDSPAVTVFALRDESGQLLGAALVIEEGGLDEDWLDAIARGERRLRGHMLPQSLVYHAGLDAALPLRCARVSRIAVQASCRRRGLGRRLLAGIEQFALDEGLDYIGSSFSADADLLPFWLGADYLPLRLGIRRDPCSGGHALLVAKPLSAAGSELLDTAYRRFCEAFPLQLRETFQALEGRLVLTLLNSLERTGEVIAPPPELRRFVSGEIAYEHAYPGLWLFLWQWRGPPLPLTDEFAIVVAKVLQARPWGELARQFGVSGRAQLEHQLRQALRWMLSMQDVTRT